ncbi:hypothetical protein [Ottowia thiooxydans]|uniref:Uncharacterized protein n=1 Tax=Ottowia thiooxydans TaxID=219182 RepID=A0ABV2Q3J3_9BURK
MQRPIPPGASPSPSLAFFLAQAQDADAHLQHTDEESRPIQVGNSQTSSTIFHGRSFSESAIGYSSADSQSPIMERVHHLFPAGGQIPHSYDADATHQGVDSESWQSQADSQPDSQAELMFRMEP